MSTAQNHPHFRPPDNKAVRYIKQRIETYKGRHQPLVEVAGSFDASKHIVECKSEDGKLKGAAMSPPDGLDWDNGHPLNEKEAHSKKPDRFLASQQWVGLVDILLKHGVQLTILYPNGKEGVYTRDVAFVIDEKLFVSNLKEPIRQPEQKLIRGGILPPPEVIIEGGNVILGNGDSVFLGVEGDGRTNREAVEWLQGELGGRREVIPIKLQPGVLHLDCAFCPLEKKGNGTPSALVYTEAFANPKDVELIAKRYPNFLHLTYGEYDNLGLNMLKLDRQTVIVHHAHERIGRLLKKEGYGAIRYDYSELILGGGSYRCTFMPFLREN